VGFGVVVKGKMVKGRGGHEYGKRGDKGWGVKGKERKKEKNNVKGKKSY
jgi:hypothetical protein